LFYHILIPDVAHIITCLHILPPSGMLPCHGYGETTKEIGHLEEMLKERKIYIFPSLIS
jgi:hypothetical protein